MTIAPEIVEKAAEALYDEHWRLRPSKPSRPPWATLGPPKAAWMSEARAALLAVLPDIQRAEREKCCAAIQADADAARAAWGNPSLADRAFNEGKDVSIEIIRALEDTP